MIANDLHKSHGSIHYFAAFDLALVFCCHRHQESDASHKTGGFAHLNGSGIAISITARVCFFHQHEICAREGEWIIHESLFFSKALSTMFGPVQKEQLALMTG